MRRPLLFLLVKAVWLVVQTALGSVIQIGGVMPDLFALYIVYLVRRWPPAQALGAAWTLGLLRDCLTPAPLGLDALALLAAAGLLVWAHRRFVLDTDIALAVLGGGSALVHGSVWAYAVAAGGAGDTFTVLFLRIALPVAVYNALLMPLFARAGNAVLGRWPREPHHILS